MSTNYGISAFNYETLEGEKTHYHTLQFLLALSREEKLGNVIFRNIKITKLEMK